MKKIFDKIISIFCIATVVFMCIISVYSIICKAAKKPLFLGGYSVFNIITESMFPTIPAGEYILVEKTTPESVEVGDVICFYSTDPAIKGSINTHRVIEISGEGTNLTFTTKGDNNPGKDSYPVAAENLVGRYVKPLNAVSTIMRILSNPLIFAVCIMIPIIVLILGSMRDIIKQLKNGNEKQNEKDNLEKVLEQMKQSGELEKYLQSSTINNKDIDDCDKKNDGANQDK